MPRNVLIKTVSEYLGLLLKQHCLSPITIFGQSLLTFNYLKVAARSPIELRKCEQIVTDYNNTICNFQISNQSVLLVKPSFVLFQNIFEICATYKRSIQSIQHLLKWQIQCTIFCIHCLNVGLLGLSPS